jgi:CheY-like chemotaxis protein
MVSGDWFARSVLRSAGEESDLFSHVIEADDGYTGLAETWQCVEDGHAPDVVVIDVQSVGASAARLVAELRTAPETQRTFIAVVGMPETDAPLTLRHVDFCTTHSVLSNELSDTIEEIAMRAAAAPQGRV